MDAVAKAPRDYTGAGLLDFLDTAGAKGWLNPGSAKALRSTSFRVLSTEQSWEDLDLRALDVDVLLDRFQNLNRNNYSDSSLRVYRSRFHQAVRMYLSRLAGDANWKEYGPTARGGARVRDRPRGHKSEKTADKLSGGGRAEPTSRDVLNPPIPDVEVLMRFPVPLRDNLDAVLSVPRDLTKSEAQRLGAILESLARVEA